MPTIFFRKRTAAAAAPPASGGAATVGEPYWSLQGFIGGGGPNALWVDDGTNLVPLVDASRQLEIAGVQTNIGAKTFSTNNLLIVGGLAGEVLTSLGAGGITWGPPAVGGGTYTFGLGLTETANNVVLNFAGPLPADLGGIHVPAGSALTVAGAGALGLAVATAGQITTGTDNVNPATSASLRQLMGADVAALTTTAQTVVPAINELDAAILSISGVLKLAGSYDAAANNITQAGGLIGNGPLPVAGPANANLYLIITVPGVGIGNAPPVPMKAGDWLVSNSTAWVHIDVGQPPITASSVGVAPAVLGATDVQTALETLAAGLVINTDASLIGDGSAANPLSVAIVDGGTF